MSVAVPELGEDGNVVPGELQETLFKNEQKWERFMQTCELARVVDKETGKQVYQFEDLEDGRLYTGVLRPSCGSLTFRGADSAERY